MKTYDLDTSINLLSSILWQYNDAENLKSMINDKNEWVKKYHTDFWNDWFRDVFNLDTANDFGLSVWAIILNISKDISISQQETRPVFGFGEYNLNFFQSNFGQTIGSVSISRESFRKLLKSRLLAFNTDCTIPSINKILSVVFSDNVVYAIDSLDMSPIVYVFETSPSSDEFFLIEYGNVLISPAGVGYKILSGIQNNFGFGEYHMNFYQGNFYIYEG